MKINKTKAMAVAFVCVLLLSVYGAIILSAPPPDSNLLAQVQEIKVELEAAGVDASDASLYGEQIWALTGNNHSWATIRDAIDDIKDEVEAAGVDASDSEFYARAIWDLAGNSHGWVSIRDAIDEMYEKLDVMEQKLDDLQASPSQMIYTDEGFCESSSSYACSGTILTVETSDVSKITFTYMAFFDNIGDSVEFMRVERIGMVFYGQDIEDMNYVATKVHDESGIRTATVVGDSLQMRVYEDWVSSVTQIWWYLTVECKPDTEVTVTEFL